MQQRLPLPVSEDTRFQDRVWLLERCGRALLGIFVLLAMLGVFSRGILSTAKAERDGVPLSVDHERFQRKLAPTQFTIHTPKQTEDEIWLRLGSTFRDAYDIESVSPPPVRSALGSGGISLFFDSYDRDDLTVVIRARPRRAGTVNIEIARPPGQLRFPVLVYP